MNSKQSSMYVKCSRMQQIANNMFSSKFNFSKDDRVLDVGCGPGNFTFSIANDVKSVVGIDVSKDMIEYAQQHYQSANVQYIACDAQNFGSNLSKWKNSFDKVVSMHVLHWVKDKRKAIKNIYECLESGGELFIVVCGPMERLLGNKEDELPFYLEHHPKWTNMLKDYENAFYNDLNIADWSNLLETEGFSLVDNECIPTEECIIANDAELEGHIRTLVGHLRCIPEERHNEFVQDAVEWGKRRLPLNSDGFMYAEAECYFIRAQKK